MRILKLKEPTIVEHVSISIGLSISLIMLLGFLANALGPLIGVQNPLSLFFLLFPLSILVLIMCAYIHLTEKDLESKTYSTTSKESTKGWPIAIILIGLPLISLLGCFLSTAFFNNTILLFLILGISGIFLLTVISARIVPVKLYPLVLFAIAIALLLQTTMVSQYINGFDIHGEYYCFVLTKNNSYWTPGLVGVQSYSDMLSITILPVFYSVVLNLSGELVFKVAYPIIYSIVPVILFYVYKEFFEEKRAILAVFFFMSFATFYVQMAYLARQMIAELFFVLLLLLYAKNGFNIRERAQVFVLFMFFFGIVVSHYAMTYFLIFYVLCFVLVALTKDHKLNMRGTTHLLLLLALAFTWYIFASSGGAFNDLASSLHRMVTGFSDFFASRDINVLKAIGVVSVGPSVWREIGRNIFYIVEIFIVVGFLKLVSTRKRLGPNQLYFSGTLASMLLLVFSIAIPNFSTTLNMTRIFAIALFFLAPMLVLGGETLFNLILRMLSRLHKGLSWGRVQRICLVLIALLIVVFFLFQSGFIFALVGDIPVSPSLTTDRSKALENLSLYDSYTFGEEVYGAKWVLVNISNQSQIYCDSESRVQVLRSYGLVSNDRIYLLSEDLKSIDRNAYVYLRHLNTVYRIIENDAIKPWIIPENSSVLQNANRIYSNAGCEIFKGIGG
jgi:uncharacterized membrane protein